MIEKFNEPKIISIIGDIATGKSNLVYHLIEKLKSKFKFNLYTYGLRKDVKDAKKIYSINELENIRNGIIFLDEFFTIFDIDNRKKRGQIENTLRLIHHNNNILVLIGVPENFKKFISSKINVTFYKQVTLADFINGSSVKKNILNYKGMEMGSSILNLKKEEVIIYDSNYKKYQVPYLEQYDTKKDNQPLLIEKRSKNVQENVRKKVKKCTKK